MATQAHCAYCFESLAASFEKRNPLSLEQVEELWTEYTQPSKGTGLGAGDAVSPPAKPAAISRLLNPSPDSGSGSSTPLSTPSSSRSASSTPAKSTASSSTSVSSLPVKEPSHPLFVTWNTLSRSGHTSLRGCIGTFEPLPISQGLHDYALTSAFDDHRFDPISASTLPSLQVCVTLLTNFSSPDADPLNWTVGEHGIRLGFTDKGRRYSSTYLPDVASEQGWGKEEAILSLMRKAGWTGRRDRWRDVKGLEIVRYEGKKVTLDYAEWKGWRDWVDKKGFR